MVFQSQSSATTMTAALVLVCLELRKPELGKKLSTLQPGPGVLLLGLRFFLRAAFMSVTSNSHALVRFYEGDKKIVFFLFLKYNIFEVFFFLPG